MPAQEVVLVRLEIARSPALGSLVHGLLGLLALCAEKPFDLSDDRDGKFLLESEDVV